MAAVASKMLNAMMNQEAFKIIDIGDIPEGGMLGVEKLAEFVRTIRENSPVLGEVSYDDMKSYTKEIPRIDMANGILTPGRDNTGAKRTLTSADEAKVDIHTNSLTAKELIAQLTLDYDTLEDNLEQQGFEDTVINLMGLAAKEDLERYFWYANTSIAWGDTKVSKLLSINDGWLKTAGGHIYGKDGASTSKDFDPSASNYPINLFDALIKKMPKKYLADRQNFRLYVPFDVEDAYRDILADRGTVLGDNALIGNDNVTYKKIPVVNVPCFDDETYTAVSGIPAMLTKPVNHHWGLWRQIRVENDKDIKARNVFSVMTLRGDCTYEDENAAVTAWINKAAS